MARYALLYDEDCGFCRWCAAKALAWDRRRLLRPVALQEPEANDLLGGMDEGRKMASWHLSGDGEVYSSGAAVPALLRLLPGGRPLAAVSSRLPGPVDRAYRFVARHRNVFGRLVTAGAARRARRRIESRAAHG